MIVKDISLDSDNDLLISEAGDFLARPSDKKHVEHIIRANKGEYKEDPLLGVGINSRLNASLQPTQLKKDIKLQLVRDGYRVQRINISRDFELDINAERIE